MSEYDEKAREISIDVLRHLKWCPETPESQNHAIAQIQPTIFAAIEEAVAAEQEACARTADDHKGSAAKERLERGQRLSKVWPEEARESIRDEERGEDIAAEIIARTIRARS